jgi:hypothetical protein
MPALMVAASCRVPGSKLPATLSGDLNLRGTLAAPQGRFSVSGRELRFALPKQHRLPTLGLDLGGTWNGRELAMNGRVNGIKGDKLELSGTAPLVLSPAMAGEPRQRSNPLCVRSPGQLRFQHQPGHIRFSRGNRPSSSTQPWIEN